MKYTTKISLILFVLLGQLAGAQTISDKLTSVNDAKINIRDAIASQGVVMTGTAFTDYHLRIAEIEGGGGGVAGITGEFAEIATYGETITAGDMVVNRVIRSYDFGNGPLSSVSFVTPIHQTSATVYSAEFSPNGKNIIISQGTTTNRHYTVAADGNLAYLGLIPNQRGRLGEFSPQGDIFIRAITDIIDIYSVDYDQNGVASFVLQTSDLDAIDISFGYSNQVRFNASGTAFFSTSPTSPWLYVYKRLTDYTFAKLANPETLPGVALRKRGTWTQSGKEILLPIDAGGVAIYGVDVDTGTTTRHDDLPGATRVEYVKFSGDGSLLVCSRSTTSPSTYVYSVDYVDGIASFTMLDDLPSDTLGRAYEAAFLGGDSYLIVGKYSYPYYSSYTVDATGAVATFTELTGHDFSAGELEYRSEHPTQKSFFAFRGGTPYGRLVAATFDTSIELVDEVEALYLPRKITDYWQSTWFGYALESGTAGQQKEVMRLPGGYAE